MLKSWWWALAPSADVDLRILGRVLLHASLVGAAAGGASALFTLGVDHTQALLLQRLAGYTPLRAAGA